MFLLLFLSLCGGNLLPGRLLNGTDVLLHADSGYPPLQSALHHVGQKYFFLDVISRKDLAVSSATIGTFQSIQIIASELRLHLKHLRYETFQSIQIPALYTDDPLGDIILEYQERFDVLRKFLILVIILVCVFVFLLYRKLRYISKINWQLEKQKEEITTANRKLQDLNAMRDKLFSIIAHDLRNPFASIVSFSRIIKRDIDELDQQELIDLTEELDKSVNRINNLFDNLLQWSLAQSGKLSYRPEYLLLSEAVGENTDLFVSVAHEKGVVMSNMVDPDLVVWSDRNMTNSIIRNLLSNAIKYIGKGGSITVNAERVEEMIHVSVADTGVGISKDNKFKLFKADSVLTTHGTSGEKGSGLGLLLSKEFAERQGGAIWFVSEQGVGSTFFFSLPVEER